MTGRLILANLSYRAGLAGYALGMAAALALAANLVLPALGLQPAPDDDFKLPFLLPVFVLLASLVVAIGAQVGESREHHLARQAVLPLTPSQVGWARSLLPAGMILAGLALAEGLMAAILVLMGIEPAAWRFLFLAFFAGQFLVLAQLPAFLTGIRRELQRSRALKIVFSSAILVMVALFLLRTLSRYVELDPGIAAAVQGVGRLSPESPASSVLLHGLGWALVLANYVLFRRRRAWI